MEKEDVNSLSIIGYKPWKGSICLEVSEPSKSEVIADVLKYVGTMEYQLPKSVFNGKHSFEELDRLLTVGARKYGFHIVRDTGGKQNTPGSEIVTYSFVCSKYLTYKPNKKTKVSINVYLKGVKQTRAHGRSSRGTAGKVGPRKTVTERTTSVGNTCKFRFSIKLLNCGAWVICKNGNAQHYGHPRLSETEMKTPRKVLSPLDHKLIADVRNGGGNKSVCAGVMRESSGHILTTGQVAYSHEQAQQCLSNAEKTSSAAKLISFLKGRHDVTFTMLCTSSSSADNLFSKPKGRPKKTKLINVTKKSGKSSSMTEESDLHASDSALDDAERMKNALKLADEKRMMLCMLWITDEGHRKFKMFPEIMLADVTAQTNTEKRPLFLLVGRDSNGHAFTIGYAYLPSEKKWVFSWLFGTGIPALVDKAALRRNKACITDGDPNEYLSFEYAADKWGGGSKHFLCFWHLTTQNWRVRVGSPSKADEETNAFYDTAKNWVKSWFTIGVKTRTEFDYSTQRFYKWMAQEKTKEALGDKVSTIKKFFCLIFNI